MRRGAFLDRDGVLNVDREYVHKREDFAFIAGVFEAARRLKGWGFALVVVSNQSGIGRGLFSEQEFATLTAWMKQQFVDQGAALDGIYYCPHHPTEAVGDYRRWCDCRKPQPGMFFSAARDLDLALESSVMFGDRLSDLHAARAAGVPVRYFLGTDGRSTPPPPAADNLATACFADLLSAVSSEHFAGVLDYPPRAA